MIIFFDMKRFHAMDNTGKRLKKSCLFERQILGFMEYILPYNVRRQENIFSECTEDFCMHDVFTEVVKLFPAISAYKTGSTVHCHYCITFLKTCDSPADF